MNQQNIELSVRRRMRWTRPSVRLLNASHARIGTQPSNDDGAFSTS